jgi:hypothetical protein
MRFQNMKWGKKIGLAALAGLGVMTLGGCYGSYSYSSYHYDPPCAPAAVVVHETYCPPVYCAPRPVIVVDHYHGGGHYHSGGHYHGGHRGRRW